MLLQTLISRLMKQLVTRRGVLVEDMGQTYLAEPDADGEDARTLRPLKFTQRRIEWRLLGSQICDRYGSTRSAAPVRLIELLTYRNHRLSIAGARPQGTALENGRVQQLVGLWRLYFETGHRHRDFRIDRMTGSGRFRVLR